MMQSPWMRVMLEEIERKRRDALEAVAEHAKRAAAAVQQASSTRARAR